MEARESVSRVVLDVRQAGFQRRSRSILTDVSLQVASGEILGLVGPNGGGKSTLLLLCAGLLRPTSGTIQVVGHCAKETSVMRAGAVGLITADHGVYPLLTGWENLRFFGRLFGLDDALVKGRVGDFVEALGLGAAMNQRTQTYSSGMKQKLSLARARMMDPRLLLMDEPTANLDPVSADTLLQAVRSEASRGVAVVWVTHDLLQAQRLCDQVGFVNGRFFPFSEPTNLLAQFRQQLGST